MASIKDQDLSKPLTLSGKETPKRPHTQHVSTPAPEASPEQIRAYLSHLLMTKRKLPEDYVRPVVARWQLGSGQELRSYSPAMYLRIFGHEDGWIIYREVMLAKLREDADAKSMTEKKLRCMFLLPAPHAGWYLTREPVIMPAIAISFTIFTIMLMVKGILHEGVAVIALTLGMGASVLSFVWAFLTWANQQSPEEVVDGALYACTKNIVTQPNDDSVLVSSKA